MNALPKFAAEQIMHTEALVVICDLQGFSRFLDHPNTNLMMPRLLNHVFRELEASFNGGKAWWVEKDLALPPLQQPAHVKFLGDGAMLVWKVGTAPGCLDRQDTLHLIELLWLFNQNFPRIVQQLSRQMDAAELPRRIRFGIATGSVYELTCVGSVEHEYIGHTINLASRLQNYCPEVSFLVSAPIGTSGLRIAFENVIAKRLRGLREESVWVPRSELADMPNGKRGSFFKDALVYYQTRQDAARNAAVRILRGSYIQPRPQKAKVRRYAGKQQGSAISISNVKQDKG